MLLLVQGDPLNERKPDEYFSAEAVAAKDLGWDAAVVDHDALERGDFMAAVERVRQLPNRDQQERSPKGCWTTRFEAAKSERGSYG